MRTAATADGRLLARDVECLFDTGAYADNGPRVVATGGDAAPGPYRWAAYRVDASCVYTNLAPAGSYRAFGAVHLQWIGESQVDEVARRAGLDPLEIRRRNLLAPGEEVRPGGKPLDADLVGDVEKVAAARRLGRAEGAAASVAASRSACSRRAPIPVSSAVCRLEADGRVVVLVGTTEMGQGPSTAFAQIAAEELGVEAETVSVRGADTRFTPYDRSTGASRSTTIAGLAVQRAAEDVRAQLEEIAGDVGDRRGRVPRADAQAALRLRRRRADRSRRGRIRRAPAPMPRARSSGRSASAAAEVEVDPDTGIVRCAGLRPWPTWVARSTRSSSSARTRERRCRESATGCSKRWSSRTACSSTTRCSTTAYRRSRTFRAR